MKNLILLHFVVLIFGFTAILGKLISIPSDSLVWYRMFIASISIGIYMFIKRKSFLLPLKGTIQTILVGFVIAAHWILFFEAIKQSNVSITLSAIATTALFTALLEPLFFKRRIFMYELLLGSVVIVGLYFIFRFEADNSLGIWLAIASAFLASLFTVINGKLIKQYDSTRISLYELSGGVIAISLYFLLFNSHSFPNFIMSVSDGVYLLLLAIICTAFAFVAGVKVMEELTPFTVSLTINLEPVYGIILAFLFFGEAKEMSGGFFVGTIMILSSIFLNIWFKRRLRKKAK